MGINLFMENRKDPNHANSDTRESHLGHNLIIFIKTFWFLYVYVSSNVVSIFLKYFLYHESHTSPLLYHPQVNILKRATGQKRTSRRK